MRNASRELEVLLIHRPRYDDWSFPKGKLDLGESYEEAGLREVLEETGLRCRLGQRLSTVRYSDAAGRPKEVRYWLMSVESGDVATRPPDREVDRVLWATPARAGELLTYKRDHELLSEAVAAMRKGSERGDD